MKTEDKHIWWQKEIIYQIYPRSFMDSTGDGIGDLNGILQRLDYIKDLGVKGVWLSPIFPSPMADFGYDVSDYIDIHPMFGTMGDFDHLLKEIHNRGLKLILDFVPNHSSDQHEWFKESRSSRDNPKRDWYIWREPAPDGGPPNNWLSVFGGSGWELDEKTGQFYYHAFLKEQPDLNWRNVEVQEAMLNAMKFWLDKGVDGFRVDVMWHMIKDEQFRNNPVNPDYSGKGSTYGQLIPAFSTDQPEVHKIVELMRSLMDKYEKRVLIGEIYLPIHKLVTYYGLNNKEAHLPFNFSLIELPWDAKRIEAAVEEYEGSLPAEGWPNWVLGNHDKSRIATRVGEKQAKIAAILLLSLKGTPTMYYGDEIGMTDVIIPKEKIQDPRDKNVSGKGLNRDPERTPMQWDDSKFAGFSNSEPWLPLMDDYEKVNVQKEKEDPESILNFYLRLIKLRQQEPALHIGEYIPVTSEGNLFTYLRTSHEREFLIILNMGNEEENFDPDLPDWRGIVTISTNSNAEGKEVEGKIKIAPNHGMIIKLNPRTNSLNN